MLGLSRKVAVAGLALAAAASAFAFGTDGVFDDIHAYIAEGVAGDDASAVKINNFIEQESPSLSKDFVTFSKVVKESSKDDFGVIPEEVLATEFSDILVQSSNYGVNAFLHLSNVAAANPLKATKILKSQAKYIVKEGKAIAKFNKYYGEGADSPDMAKAAVAWSHVQKLYEIIEKTASKFDVGG